MPSCQQITELVTDYLEGRLSLGQRLLFQVHLGMCGHCRAYLRQMQQTIQTVGRLPEETLPPHVEQELLRRFQDWRGQG